MPEDEVNCWILPFQETSLVQFYRLLLQTNFAHEAIYFREKKKLSYLKTNFEEKCLCRDSRAVRTHYTYFLFLRKHEHFNCMIFTGHLQSTDLIIK